MDTNNHKEALQLKVCGITSTEQLEELAALGVDYAGLIFYPPSKRFAAGPLQGQAAAVQATGIRKIGVFVNATADEVSRCIEEYGLHAIQLHGDETDEFCLEFTGRVEVIKVFRIGAESDIQKLTEPFAQVCDYFLFDTDTETYGGSGRQFNWMLLQNATLGKPFFLSGGIGPEDVDKIKAFRHPQLFGVDVNSRFETTPGVKDMEQVTAFAHQIKTDGKS